MPKNVRYWLTSIRSTCFAALGFGLIALCVTGLLYRQPLLEQVANIWTVSDPIIKSDAAVILGGGVYGRTKIAAELYRKGLVKTLLISSVRDSSHAVVGAHFSDTALSQEMLRKYGIPKVDIEIFGTANQNTREEAVALKDWSDKNLASSFIIPTEFFFSRRVHLIFKREFASRNAKISVIAFDPEEYSRKNWSTSNEGVRAFKTEVLKLAYNMFRY
jgi:DUF218 domain